MVLKKYKGRWVIVIDMKEKCLSLLHTDSFNQPDHDPTEKIEGKI